MESKKLTLRQWSGLLLIGLCGQLAWCIENNYINMWVYSQSSSTSAITWMSVFSAIAATLTTIFMGALSDKLGNRKTFIAVGYVVWGLSVVSFSFINRDNMSALFGDANAVLGVGIFMVVLDCIMTFFGSTSNDACFNARVTEITTSENRGKVETALSVLPLFANVIVLLVAGIFGANAQLSDTQKSQISAGESTASFLKMPWFYFFLAFGLLMVIVGMVSLFLLEKDKIAPKKDTKYWSNLVYGFKPSVIKKNPKLYIALLGFMAFNTAINCFMPFYMVYFQNDTQYGGAGVGSGTNFFICLGSILIAASLLAIIVGLFMDKIGKMKLLLPALALTGLGLLLMYFSHALWAYIISGILMMGGYLISTAILGAIIRDETPTDQVGLFQGVRMVFVVLIPFAVGTPITNLVFQLSGITYTDSYNQTSPAPTAVMFLVALGFIVLALAPSLWLILREKKNPKVLVPSSKEETKRESDKTPHQP